MPVFVAIYTFIVSAFGALGTWLAGSWVALSGWLSAAWLAALTWFTTTAAMRVTIYGLLIVAFLTSHVAFTSALIAVLPASDTVTQVGAVSGGALGGSVMTEFWAWLAFLKPAHFEAYVSAMASSAGALYIFNNAVRIWKLKSFAALK